MPSVDIKKRTPEEKIDYLIGEFALLKVKVGELEASIDFIKKHFSLEEYRQREENVPHYDRVTWREIIESRLDEISKWKQAMKDLDDDLHKQRSVLKYSLNDIKYKLDKLRCAKRGVDPLWYEDDTLERELKKLDKKETASGKELSEDEIAKTPKWKCPKCKGYVAREIVCPKCGYEKDTPAEQSEEQCVKKYGENPETCGYEPAEAEPIWKGTMEEFREECSEYKKGEYPCYALPDNCLYVKRLLDEFIEDLNHNAYSHDISHKQLIIQMIEKYKQRRPTDDDNMPRFRMDWCEHLEAEEMEE